MRMCWVWYMVQRIIRHMYFMLLKILASCPLDISMSKWPSRAEYSLFKRYIKFKKKRSDFFNSRISFFTCRQTKYSGERDYFHTSRKTLHRQIPSYLLCRGAIVPLKHPFKVTVTGGGDWTMAFPCPLNTWAKVHMHKVAVLFKVSRIQFHCHYYCCAKWLVK